MNPNTKYKLDPKPSTAHPDAPKQPEPYIAGDPLIKAVNLAIFLRRPLLLEGEAGCGKTRLASDVAYDLGLPLYRWDIRSDTKAQEGLYKYDAILRLHDVQTREVNPDAKRNPSDATKYRDFGALGKAFLVDDRPAVVLIDEIDKADVDFPNDLLAVLDDPWSFEVRETQEPPIIAKHKPIVIITTNKEKSNLPAPFLRRCIYHFVEFPKDKLKEIVEIHYQVKKEKAPSANLIDAAVSRFTAIREAQNLFKSPGTSEFLDWLNALQKFDAQPYTAKELAKPEHPIPYRELLFKIKQDWQKYAAT
ncbi:MAG: MoxR family ATPase [Pseudanabaena sp. M135S2SP2A07QC]|jgi:MoxR-like ATPase|nr:MoxR family ATPase [Pseudanabaena sp. M090S1SP2A07QC]MCA6504974.1 MoxR family ATPase [Pseudanabaena sp. M172S2SP2A07QC]MCA6518748.1 MoxR family ATPase [Pseudanabaena sp. M110S1SP2A07QC]MCA6520770.1 MoxR family ATPase [Pseudanabaena sp. M051S1SP2A07QC]MCA6526357.1 MoxR family ATPase [Pseudanabaena sp. M179S2SP2A07QC]MCA6532437.1 MoxR family ATPase [Pseudanabaena sp. M125S2SP2A07QC]MCA6537145.1 MoxR family ATPase [Pseudanabaena sp. M176S2SP2A07QC]MCA6538808.1 MoxR family ATPase [Pseudanabae